ncbi:MAG: carbohydrate ABC transporter permease [Roseiflexaceae bacterium]
MDRRRSVLIRESLTLIGFVALNITLLIAFTFYPLIRGIELSLYQWDFISPFRIFVGTRNYVRLWNDSTFWTILQNTLVFTGITVLTTIVLALGLALLLTQQLKGREWARGIMFLPTLLSGAAIALVFNYILDYRYGLVQQFLQLVGSQMPNWYTDPFWAMTVIIITVIWKQVGYAAVILIAGLQSIDYALYEAASIDGANRRAKFWYITLPGLAPMILFVAVTGVLGAFQSFDIIRVMTSGGPVNATNVLVYELYRRGFVNFEAGPAGVLTVVIFLVMLVFTIVQLNVGKRNNAV